MTALPPERLAEIEALADRCPRWGDWDELAQAAIRDLLAEREWTKIEDCPPEWKDGRQVMLGRKGDKHCAKRNSYLAVWGKERWLSDPGRWPINGCTHIRELPEPPPHE